jgi:hypothetical protein
MMGARFMIKLFLNIDDSERFSANPVAECFGGTPGSSQPGG